MDGLPVDLHLERGTIEIFLPGKLPFFWQQGNSCPGRRQILSAKNRRTFNRGQSQDEANGLFVEFHLPMEGCGVERQFACRQAELFTVGKNNRRFDNCRPRS